MENPNQGEFRLIKSTYRGCLLLIHQNFVFQKNYDNKDGSINWRCQNNRIKGPDKCSVTCRTINNTFIRPPIVTEHNHHILEKISSFLSHMYKFYYNSELSWNFHLIHARSFPIQRNSFDCGMYVCKFAEFLIYKRAFTFDDSSMPRYRRKMVLSILRRKIVTNF
jgi:hypothetical protein